MLFTSPGATSDRDRVHATPMGRVGRPEGYVGAFLFLASGPLSGYVTGQIIEVNGGQLML